MITVTSLSNAAAKLPPFLAQKFLEDIASSGELNLADLRLIMAIFETYKNNNVDFDKVLEYINMYQQQSA